MKTRQILIAILILATVWHTAAAQPKKKNISAEAPPPESILAGTSMQSNSAAIRFDCAQTRNALGPTRRS